MTTIDDISKNYEANEREALIASSLEEQEFLRRKGDPNRLRLDAVARAWGLELDQTGEIAGRPIEDGYRIAAE